MTLPRIALIVSMAISQDSAFSLVSPMASIALLTAAILLMVGSSKAASWEASSSRPVFIWTRTSLGTTSHTLPLGSRRASTEPLPSGMKPRAFISLIPPKQRPTRRWKIASEITILQKDLMEGESITRRTYSVMALQHSIASAVEQPNFTAPNAAVIGVALTAGSSGLPWSLMYLLFGSS